MIPFVFPESERERSLIKERKQKGAGGWEVRTYTVHSISNTGKIRKHAPDDLTYTRYPGLRERVPRGCSDLYMHGQFVYALRGLPKFDATSSIDQDECEEEDGTQPEGAVSCVPDWQDMEVITQEKLNGKLAIFALLDLAGKRYLFGGSKNVHILHEASQPVRGKEVHHEVLRQAQKKAHLAVGVTYVGELVDGMHIVAATEPTHIQFFHEVRELLPRQTTPLSPTQLHMLRRLTGIEGAVIVYRNVRTGQEVRQKHKTIWYVIWRAVREKLKRNASLDQMLARLAALQSYIQLSVEEQQTWQTTLEAFWRWFPRSGIRGGELHAQVSMASVLESWRKGEEKTCETPTLLQVLERASTALPEGLRLTVCLSNPPVTPLGPTFTDLPTFDTSNAPVRICVGIKPCPARGDVVLMPDLVPAYYGLFPAQNLAEQFGRTAEQKTPLHVTCLFVGGAKSKDFPPRPDLLGTLVECAVTGISDNEAGTALLVSCASLPGDHITLTTKPNFKPAEVGLRLEQEVAHFAAPTLIRALYLPFF